MELLQVILALVTKAVPVLLAIKSLDRSIDDQPISADSFRVVISYLVSLVIIDFIKSIINHAYVGYILDLVQVSIFINNINNNSFDLTILNQFNYKLTISLQATEKKITAIFKPESDISIFHFYLLNLKNLLSYTTFDPTSNQVRDINYPTHLRDNNHPPPPPPRYVNEFQTLPKSLNEDPTKHAVMYYEDLVRLNNAKLRTSSQPVSRVVSAGSRVASSSSQKMYSTEEAKEVMDGVFPTKKKHSIKNIFHKD